jgi:stage II sporulation protein M
MKPILSIISALLITIIPFIVLYDGLVYHVNIIILIFLFIIFNILGGCMSTWFSKENKIRYSLYYGLLSLIIFGIVLQYIFGHSYFMYILSPIFAVIGGIIAKEEKDGIKDMLNNRLMIDYRTSLVDLYKRNRIFLFASLGIFLGSMLIGSVGPLISSSFKHFMINLTINYFTTIRGDSPTTLSIFLNNSTLAFIYLYVGGFGFGILSTLELIKIGLLTSFISVEYPRSIIYVLPHGIFELSAYIIATAAGFKLLSITISLIRDFLEINDDMPINEQINRILDVNYLKFRDSLILILIAIIMLFIAAIIEANITIPLANYILS